MHSLFIEDLFHALNHVSGNFHFLIQPPVIARFEVFLLKRIAIRIFPHIWQLVCFVEQEHHDRGVVRALGLVDEGDELLVGLQLDYFLRMLVVIQVDHHEILRRFSLLFLLSEIAQKRVVSDVLGFFRFNEDWVFQRELTESQIFVQGNDLRVERSILQHEIVSVHGLREELVEL